MSVPGVGPMTASAMVAAIGDGSAFSKGRDFAAWLGLVPKQISTGDRTILGGISRRGNSYLRTLFIQGARCSSAVRGREKKSFGRWLIAASKRLHKNVLAVASANKLARIACRYSIMLAHTMPPTPKQHHGCGCEPEVNRELYCPEVRERK